jgi:hypothetical protein
MCQIPSEYKLESCDFAWTRFASLSMKLYTQIKKFFEIR